MTGLCAILAAAGVFTQQHGHSGTGAGKRIDAGIDRTGSNLLNGACLAEGSLITRNRKVRLAIARPAKLRVWNGL